MALYDDLLKELNNKQSGNMNNSSQKSGDLYNSLLGELNQKQSVNRGSLYNDLLGEMQAKYPNNSAAKLAEARAQREAEEAKKKEEEEKKKAEETQKEEIKKQIAEVSKAGVNTNNTLRGNKPVAPLASNMQVVKPSNEEKIEEYKDNKGILYKMSDGEVDDRNYIQKAKDDIINAIGNIGYSAGNGLINAWQAIQRGQQNRRNQEYETLKETSKGSNEILDKIYNSENPLGKIVSEKLNKQKQINQKNIQRNIEKSSNSLSKKVSELSANVGNMAIGTGLSAIDPSLGTTYFITSAMQDYYDDGKARGMTDEEANRYSILMGIAEGGSEMVGVGNLAKGTKAISKSALRQGLKDLGIGAVDNAIQEAIIEPTSELAAGKYADWDNMGQRMLQAGIDGALVGGIMAGAGAGVGSAVNVYDKVKNNQKVSTLEINNAINDTKQAGISIDNRQQNPTNPIPLVNTLENNQNTLYNNIKIGEIKNININDISNLISQGGYRTEEQINRLKEDIKKNGITTPIEIYRKNDGTIAIENGNHRLKIAQELGIKDIPVKMVESWENVLNKTQENKINTDIEEEIYNDRFAKGNSNINEKSRNSNGSMSEVNELFRDKRTTGENVEILKGKPNSDQFASNVQNKGDNRRQIKNSNQSSFSIQENKPIPPIANNKRSSDSNYRLQLPSETNTTSIINNSIPPTNQNVNSDTITNNYTQNYENNAQNEKNPTRHDVIQQYRNLAKENIENISTWKDKKRGLSYQLETMERNMYDIIPDKAEAQRIIDTYFTPIHESEAQKQKFINKYNDKIKELNLNKYESEAVQLLGEQKYNPDFKVEEVQEILDKVNNNVEKGKIDKQKVSEAIEVFRNIYDELFEIENKVLRDNGYKEKPYRKGYFPHFIDYVPETKTEKLLNRLGFKIDKRPLPTDIAGITEQFVPGKTWNKSALERKGNKTDYNALKGFDTYIAQASDNIFHTDNIQRLRGLENEIRYQYSDKGIQERVDNILNDKTLFEDEKQSLLDQILEQTNNPMPNLVTELRRYTNALANKKSEADRSIENMMGRSVYSTVNAIENRFGANAVGLNIGSAITNFIPLTQAWSQVGTVNMGRATIDTIKSYINHDGFVDKSAFLTSRLKQAEKLYKSKLEKASDVANIPFNAIDDVTSNIVVRGKYLENIKSGMTEEEALKNADQFARNVMADRSKGALPTKFEEKNPITKAFTQFQLEVNNQYRYMFKDLPRDLAEKGLGAIALAFFKMFVGAWIYNEASEKITGRRPAFDPIDIALSAYKDITDEKKGTYDKIASIGKNVTEELPFVGGLVGGGRIPVNGAIPDIANLTKAGVGLATGEMDSKKAISNIGKEVSKPLYYLVPPFGGGQLKKTKEGLETIINGGSYGVDSKRKRLASISCRRRKC